MLSWGTTFSLFFCLCVKTFRWIRLSFRTFENNDVCNCSLLLNSGKRGCTKITVLTALHNVAWFTRTPPWRRRPCKVPTGSSGVIRGWVSYLKTLWLDLWRRAMLPSMRLQLGCVTNLSNYLENDDLLSQSNENLNELNREILRY